MRIARWNLRLQDYDMIPIHKPGEDNMADYMSRHPIGEESTSKNYAMMIQNDFGPRALEVDEIAKATIYYTTYIVIFIATILLISNILTKKS